MPAILTSDSMDAPESKEEVVVIDEEVDSRSKESKGVDSVTDYVAEKESANAEQAQAALGSISSAAKSSGSAAIVIREEDTRLLMDECEISKEAAEALLEAASGDIKKAIQAYIKSPLALA